MGRRRRRHREPGYVWWIGFAGLGLAAVWLASWRIGLFALLVWCLYEFALIPTLCRVMTREGFACHEAVRGRLFACSSAHQQVKNDAVWRAAGLRNPFHKTQPLDPNRDTGVVVYSPAVRARLPQNDRIILTLAGLGTLASVAGALIGLTH
jgi:hypothetical protein